MKFKTLLILPGFALHPPDYAKLVSCLDIPTQTINIWPESLDDIRVIGSPSSHSFEKWMHRQAEHCRNYIDDSTLIFAHSAGSEIGKRLGIPMVTFGYKNIGQLVCIQGTLDPILIHEDASNIIHPKCGHFSCVTEEAAIRCMFMQYKLSGYMTCDTDYIAAHEEIANVILDYF